MSKVKKLLGVATQILGMGAPKAPAVNIPAPAIPAPPAPVANTDTGASIAVGTSADIKNQRVSGRSAKSSSSSSNILGGLGRSGLNI